MIDTADKSTRTFTLAGILLAMFLGALDQTIVATALPRIVADLRGLERYAWVATAYLLASTVLVPIYGKLADSVSRRAIEIAAVSIFLAGSFLSGVAGQFGDLPLIGDGMNQLIVFRGLQGLGGAGLFAMAFIIIADLFPPAERARYQGLVGGVFGIASVIGPLVGGFLADNATGWIQGVAGWRWVFYVNLPIGIVALALIVFRMPRLAPKEEGRSVNYLSALFLIATTVPLILALELDKGLYPWGGSVTLGLFAGSLAMLVIFVLVSRTGKQPVLDLSLFSNKVFRTGNIALFLFGAGFLSVIIFLPLFMVNVVGVSATKAGVSIIPLSVGLVVGSILSGQLVSRIGRYKPFMLGGAAIFTIGAALLASMTADVSYWVVTLYMVIVGIGIGPTLPLFPLAVQNAVPEREVGQATSATQFFRQIGATVGTAIMGTVLATGLASAFASNFSALDFGGPDGAPNPIVAGLQAGNDRFSASGPQEIRQSIEDAFASKYDLIERAFTTGDQSAMTELQADQLVPQDYKDQLADGTPAELIHAQFDAEYEAIAAAVRSNDQQALAPMLARLPMPASAADQIRQAAQSRNPASIDAILVVIRDQLDAQAIAVAGQATQTALAAIHDQLNSQATVVADTVVGAVKRSFAAAVTRIYFYVVVILVAGFIVTLFVPELDLRRKGEDAAARS